MLSWESNVEVHALRRQGWSISAIARHVGVSRLTVRRYLSGQRVPGRRVRSAVDPFEEYVEYCRLRLAGDPHVWATVLFDEVVGLGYAGSYPSFTRGLRARSLRPHCAACAGARRRDRGLIEHPPGEETQWDWVELPNPPVSWGWGDTCGVQVQRLGCDQPHRRFAASCGVAVIVDESAEHVGAFDMAKLRDRRQWRRRRGNGDLETDRAVWSGEVVMPEVLAEDLFELAAAEDQGPVQTLGPDGSDPPFGRRSPSGPAVGSSGS
jgi:hypothetical protein